jgi:parallel beta-helix repeat protein
MSSYNFAIIETGAFNVRRPFGADNTGVRASSIAIQNAVNAASAAASTSGGMGVVFFPPGAYVLDITINIPSNVVMTGYGAKLKLKDGTLGHVFRINELATNIIIQGFELDGNKAGGASAVGIAFGPGGGGGITDVLITDCTIRNCSGDGIRTTGERIKINGCTVENCDLGGITGNDVEFFTWVNNICRLNQYGIGLAGIGKHGTIDGNVCESNGLQIPPAAADQITAYGSANEFLTVSNNICRNGNNHGIHLGGKGLTITGNIVDHVVGSGIFVQDSSMGGGTSFDVTIEGNTCVDCDDSGIRVQDVENFSVVGNTIKDVTDAGILFADCTNGVICGNTCESCDPNGIRTTGLATKVAISGNTVINSSSIGIELQDITSSTVTGNNCKGNASPFSESGTADNNLITGNDFTGNTSDVIGTANSVGAASMWADNKVIAQSIVAADPLPLPHIANYCEVTGNTNFNNIPASWEGRIIVLRFTGTPTLGNTGNLFLTGGSFAATDRDTITMVSNPANAAWYEVARRTI